MIMLNRPVIVARIIAKDITGLVQIECIPVCVAKDARKVVVKYLTIHLFYISIMIIIYLKIPRGTDTL